ncbi:hypothetical protein [Burkholderia ambifaria]|uniref:hypothetical protein n=1 Tax=Burkholderia ambifaria TaxID=152480 RepID=UPI003C7B6A0C
MSRLLPIAAITIASLSAFAQAGDPSATVDKALQLIQQNPSALEISSRYAT